MKSLLTLIFVLTLTGLPVRAQSPDSIPASEVSSGPARQIEPVVIHPLDRMQSSVARQLMLLQSLGEINDLLVHLQQVGPELLVLLDESLEPKERLRRALLATPVAASATLELDALRNEVSALKLLIENSGLHQQYDRMPAPPAAEPEPPTELADWQLARSHVQYIQLPDRETLGRVALSTENARAELAVLETAEIDGKVITLRAIHPLADGGVRLTFLSDGELATIRY